MALPTWQAAGAFASTTTVGATISPAWPAHQADDVGLLIVNHRPGPPVFTDFAGFELIPNCTIQVGRERDSDSQQLSVYWKRATGAAEGSPVIKMPTYHDGTTVAGCHIRAVIVTIRGCGTTGFPWDILVSGIKDTATGTNVDIPGGTTTEADCLIVGIVAESHNVNGAIYSGWTNAGLANVTERVDSGTSSGETALGVVTGEKATAGAFGATTATGSASSRCYLTLAMSPTGHNVDATPKPVGWGDYAERDTAGSISPAWPPHQANDVGFLICASGGALAVPTGWSEVSGSPQTAGSGAARAQLHVFWKRAASGAEANPSVAFVADHVAGRILTVRGLPTTGNPWDVTAGDNTSAGATTTADCPTVTTTVPNCLVLLCGAGSVDSAFAGLTASGYTNSNLANLAGRDAEDFSIVGSGANLWLAHGIKKTTGAVGASAATLTNSTNQGRLTIALKPSAKEIDAQHGTFSYTGQSAGVEHHRVVGADQGVFAFSGQIVDLVVNKQITLEADPGVFSFAGQSVDLQHRLGAWSREPKSETDWIKESPTVDE